jgi:hypothetical protein
MMSTARKWMGGEGRGRGREKDDGTTIIVRDMGNICAYLPAMMMQGTTTRTFPVILALDLGKVANHFLAVAVSSSVFSSSLSSSLSSRVAAAMAGRHGNREFVAISIVNDNDGVEKKHQ